MSGAEIGKAKSYLYSIAGNIIKNYYKKNEGNIIGSVAGYRKG